MAKKSAPMGWTMKTDRELIALARTHDLDEIAAKLQHTPARIRQVAKRLCIKIKQASK
jgi:hypothetical protein